MKNINLLESSILKQLPGVFVLKEVRDKSYFIFANAILAKMIGYKNIEDVIGISDEDAKCDAIANNCEMFYQHDREVMRGKTIQTLDIYPYVGDDIIGILSVKKPVLDNDNRICAIMANGIPLRKKDINKIFSHICGLTPKEKKYRKCFETTYEIKETIEQFSLSKRELECLFYLMRGKSAKYIAAIMSRSVRTIEKHIDSLKSKCNMVNKSDFFDFSCAHGLLNVLPHRLIYETKDLDSPIL